MNRLAKKAIERGKQAFKDGLPIEKNPFLHSGDMGLSAWWEKGWTEASKSKPIRQTVEKQI